MSPNSPEIARRDAGNVVLRPGGIRVRWELADLFSSDGQSLRAVFSAAVRPLEGSADRKMLEETFLGASASVSAADVADHFRACLHVAAARQTAAADMPALLSDAGRSAMAAGLAEGARAVAFNCGLELLPPFELELDSPTLRQQQDEARRAAVQVQRLSRAAELFKQFEELRRAAPDLKAEEIFQRVGGADPADRAESLRLLILSSARQTAPLSLWAVAGPHLLKIDSTESGGPARCQIFTPPPLLGPLRSVQSAELNGKAVLLLGARCGVLVVDPLQPAEAAAYADPAVTSALGFNAAAIRAGKLWATHGEAGVVGWNLDQRDQPSVAARRGEASPAAANYSPRNLTALDGARLVFSSDHRLFELLPDGTINETDNTPAAGILSIIAESPTTLLLIHDDGEVCRRDRTSLRVIGRANRTGRITAAGSLPWLGATRLLLACEQGAVHCVGLDDELVTQYVGPHTGLRLVAAAPDRVAAVSADRQRVLIWPSWDGRGPAAEVHVAALARHRVADVEFA